MAADEMKRVQRVCQVAVTFKDLQVSCDLRRFGHCQITALSRYTRSNLLRQEVKVKLRDNMTIQATLATTKKRKLKSFHVVFPVLLETVYIAASAVVGYDKR
jgi:hypothetical protein